MASPPAEELGARCEPRHELVELSRASSATSTARRPVELDQQSVERLSRMNALQGEAMAAGVEARRNARVRAIEAALERLATGEFGWCDECGEPVGEKRLDLDPTAVRCVGRAH